MATRNKRGDPITPVTLKNGDTVYRFRVDYGKKPDGRRDQRTVTRRTRKLAEKERRRILTERDAGTLVVPTKRTTRDVAEAWLAGRRAIRPTTREEYRRSLERFLRYVGHIQVQKLQKVDLDRAATDLLANGRHGGGALSAAIVRESLARLKAALEVEVKLGNLTRNPCALVELPSHTRRRFKTWTAEQATRYLASVAHDRHFVGWLLSLYGLRRGEVLGLRWSDVDLTGQYVVEEKGWDEPVPTITVRWSRTVHHGRGVEWEPKTERSGRTLPIDRDLVAVLTATQLAQRAEQDAAGAAYGVCDQCGGQHVVADALGRPVDPGWYTERFNALSAAAGLPKIRLHDCRHSTAVIMRRRKVEPAIISAWLGHIRVSFTSDVYGWDPQLV